MRFVLPLLTAAVLAAVVAAASSPRPALAQKAAGTVSIIDGDTLQIGDRIVHLAGIDAPELGQRCMIEDKDWRCGLEAALALRKLAAFGTVSCTAEKDAPRVTGACQIDGKDLSEVMVGQGYAVALPNAVPSYQSAQAAARDAKLGLWRGAFIPPGDWRQGARLEGETTDTIFCVVKGAINEKDQRIFYIPSDETYEEVAIDPEKGERMFCSDDEAILAGWSRFPRKKP
jgi:endonuclease YncB( thermonuclease family)